MCKSCNHAGESRGKYYITTAIAYTSRKPHIAIPTR